MCFCLLDSSTTDFKVHQPWKSHVFYADIISGGSDMDCSTYYLQRKPFHLWLSVLFSFLYLRIALALFAVGHFTETSLLIMCRSHSIKSQIYLLNCNYFSLWGGLCISVQTSVVFLFEGPTSETSERLVKAVYLFIYLFSVITYSDPNNTMQVWWYPVTVHMNT